MSKKVTVYTTTQCAYCVMVKKYLESKGQEYSVINLDEQPELRAQAEALSGGQTVPVTVFENDTSEPTVIIGWNPNKIAAALAV